MTPRSIALAATALLSLTAAPAFATSTKTWVSSTGGDTGACPLTAPCKTFQYAHDQTTAGGEIDVKDTGSYGQVTITKAISIVSGDGALAAVGVPSGDTGITIAAGATDFVNLKGLVVDGHGVGGFGIDYHAGAGLTIERCLIRNVTNVAIDIYSQAQAYHIVDTTVSKSKTGIRVDATNTNLTGSISNVNALDNLMYGATFGNTDVIVIASTFSGNPYGISSQGGAHVLLGQTTVAGNTTDGLQVLGGTISSYGNNYINGNATDISGTLGSVGER